MTPKELGLHLRIHSLIGVFLSYTTLSLVGSGCGPGRSLKTGEDPPRALPPIVTASLPADHYYIFDAECQEQTPALPLENGIVFHSTQFGLSEPRTDFTSVGLESSPGLRGPTATQIIVGARYDRQCPSSLRGMSCDGPDGYIDWRVVAPGRSVKLCQPRSAYARESLEGIGVTTLYYLERAAQRYRAVVPSLPALRLEVVPEYSSLYVNEQDASHNPQAVRTFITRNMAYFPDRDRIVVWPEAAADQPESLKWGHLWESAFVVGHEVGHHLEHQIVLSLGIQQPLTWNGSTHSGSATQLPADSLIEHRRRIIGAISEAFADLASFYANDEDEESIRGTACIGFSRNPKDALFGAPQGETPLPKSLDVAAVTELLGPQRGSECVRPNFSDFHATGAVLAHTISRIADLLAMAAHSPADRAAGLKLRFTTAWLRAAFQAEATHVPKMGDAGDAFQFLAHAIESAVDSQLLSEGIAASQHAILRSQVCQLAAIKLPVMRPLPFANSCSR